MREMERELELDPRMSDRYMEQVVVAAAAGGSGDPGPNPDRDLNLDADFPPYNRIYIFTSKDMDGICFEDLNDRTTEKGSLVNFGKFKAVTSSIQVVSWSEEIAQNPNAKVYFVSKELFIKIQQTIWKFKDEFKIDIDITEELLKGLLNNIKKYGEFREENIEKLIRSNIINASIDNYISEIKSINQHETNSFDFKRYENENIDQHLLGSIDFQYQKDQELPSSKKYLDSYNEFLKKLIDDGDSNSNKNIK